MLLHSVLMLCVSLCCCRVGAVVAMLPTGGAESPHAVASCVKGSCCHPQNEDSSDPDAPDGDGDPAKPGCGGLCCIKGTTPDKAPKFAPALSFVGILPVAEILAPAATPARRVDRVRVPPGSYCLSLLRQRCALLI
jgi:hypothetical protein